jgi:hypothetical protein
MREASEGFVDRLDPSSGSVEGVDPLYKSQRLGPLTAVLDEPHSTPAPQKHCSEAWTVSLDRLNPYGKSSTKSLRKVIQ